MHLKINMRLKHSNFFVHLHQVKWQILLIMNELILKKQKDYIEGAVISVLRNYLQKEPKEEDFKECNIVWSSSPKYAAGFYYNNVMIAKIEDGSVAEKQFPFSVSISTKIIPLY